MSSEVRTPVVLIDGRSGSGKTCLARRMVAAWPGHVALVRLEDSYPGWDGLEAASEQLHHEVLRPLADGRSGRWQRWNWDTDAPAEWHPVSPGVPLVVEGCGALSRANRELATFGIWVELDTATRKERALARDGSAYRPFWERWARQEEQFLAREGPQMLADLVIRVS